MDPKVQKNPEKKEIIESPKTTIKPPDTRLKVPDSSNINLKVKSREKISDDSKPSQKIQVSEYELLDLEHIIKHRLNNKIALSKYKKNEGEIYYLPREKLDSDLVLSSIPPKIFAQIKTLVSEKRFSLI